VSDLYEKDFMAWSLEQAEFLRDKQFDKLDIEHLFGEVYDLGKADKRSIQSHLMQVIAHMLKYKFQKAYYTKSWQDTIDYGRAEIRDLIEDCPSLKHYPEETLDTSYFRAVKLASKQTGIEIRDFPVECPWTLNEILGDP